MRLLRELPREQIQILRAGGEGIDAAPASGQLPGIGPLGRAALCGDIGVADQLLRAGAQINGGPASPVPPVMLASWIGDGDMIGWLAKRGANLDAKAPGESATADYGDARIVDLLLNAGADKGAKTPAGETAEGLAEFWGKPHIVTRLRR